MTPRRPLPDWAVTGLLAAAIVVGVAVLLGPLPWAISAAIWWLIDNGGWPRAAVGIVLAAIGIVYAIAQHRRHP